MFYTKRKYCDMLNNNDHSEKQEYEKISLTDRVWFEIIPSIYNYIKFYRCTVNIIEINKLHRRNVVKRMHYYGPIIVVHASLCGS